jgi:hypothetical protein
MLWKEEEKPLQAILKLQRGEEKYERKMMNALEFSFQESSQPDEIGQCDWWRNKKIV